MHISGSSRELAVVTVPLQQIILQQRTSKQRQCQNRVLLCGQVKTLVAEGHTEMFACGEVLVNTQGCTTIYKQSGELPGQCSHYVVTCKMGALQEA